MPSEKPQDEDARKQKLTLSVDSKVVEKAKELGLNMSEITENVLRGFAFEPSEGDLDEVYSKYQSLFDVIIPLLKKYNIWIDIGEEVDVDEIGDPIAETHFSLGPAGQIWPAGDTAGTATEVKPYKVNEIDSTYLLPPTTILSNLIKTMADSAETNKKRLAELELARRIVEAISATTSRSKGKHVQRQSKRESRMGG